MKKLINSGSDICKKDNKSKTALMICAQYGHDDVANEMVSFILEANIHNITHGKMDQKEEKVLIVF